MRTILALFHMVMLSEVQARIIEVKTVNVALGRLISNFPQLVRTAARGRGLFSVFKNAPGSGPKLSGSADDVARGAAGKADDVARSFAGFGQKVRSFGRKARSGGAGMTKLLRALFKRDIKETKFTGNTPKLLYSYLGEFGIGSPAQKLLLLMDTGSSRLWVRGKGQCNADAERCLTYNPSFSQTFAYDDSMTPAQRITYGDGSFVEGPWVKDSVKIGDYTAQDFIFQHGTNVNDHADEDGIVGLGFSVKKRFQTTPPTLWEALISKQVPDSPVFSTYIDETETAGAFIFGGVDLARYSGNITWSSVSRKSGIYWGLDVSFIFIGSFLQKRDIPLLVIDTGSSLALFPKDLATRINQELNLPRLDIGGPSDNYYGMSCPDGKVPENTNLPRLTFGVENNHLSFSPQDYMFVYPDNQGQLVCVSGIVGSDIDHIVIGNLFNRKYYIVFDQWFRKIGFANPNRSANVNNQFQPANSRYWVPGRG